MADRVKLHQRLRQRTVALKLEYSDWEPTFRDLRSYVQPRRGRFSTGEKTTQGKLNKKIVDSTAREALKTLRSGLTAGMTPPSRPWFKLGLMVRESDLSHEEKAWLHSASMRMHTVFNTSNIYQMLPRAYEDLGLYGTHASIILPDFDNIVRAMSFPVGEFYLGQNDKEEIDSFHRVYKRTVDQVVSQFGLENCSTQVQNSYRQGDLSEKVDIEMAIEPRRNRNPLGNTSRDMPIMSAKWEKSGRIGQFLELSGYPRKPLLTPRWDVESPDVWGTSPGMDAFGDSAQLQDQHRDKAIAIQKMYNPPLQAPAELHGQRAKNFPGGVTYVSASDLQKGGFRSLYDTKPDIQGLLMDIDDVRERIRQAFFVDLFQMFSTLDRRQITAEEIIRRHEEKVLMLGPVLERLNKELLEPLVDLVFFYMNEAELLPRAPVSLEGQPIKIEFVSMLAQAQKAIGIQTLERAIGFVGTLGQIKPGALDMVDEDDMVREFWDISGTPPESLRDADTVAKLRQQQQQATQAQQMMEQAEPMANAARLISEANQRSAEVV